MANSVKAYVQEAIEIERAGVKVKETTDFECPEELIGIFAGDPDFKASFDKLTPGRQRGVRPVLCRRQAIEDAGGPHPEIPA